MELKIKVLSYKDQTPNWSLSALFNRDGGVIGRLPVNHLFLPDPEKYISRKHAVISYESGWYFITGL